MRIDAENLTLNQAVDNKNETIAHGSVSSSGTEYRSAFAVDISGRVMDNKAYEGHGKTMKDVMQEAGNIDVIQQKNYMTVMSNSMSGEDFGALLKEGYDPMNTPVEELVTVVDRIKAELVKAGVDVSGYTDTLDKDTLTNITGNEAQAQMIVKKLQEHNVPVTRDNVTASGEALEKAKNLSELSEGARKYMVENKLQPSIDELYQAEYSAKGNSSRQSKGYYADSFPGYYAKKADNFQWEQLQPQMDRVAEEAGLSKSDTVREEEKWLIEKGIPLTSESLLQLHTLNQGSVERTPEEWAESIAKALEEGKQPGDALFLQQESIYEKAVSLEDTISSITEEAIARAAERGEVITIQSLSLAQREIQAGTWEIAQNKNIKDTGNTDNSNNPDNTNKIQTTKAQLEEIRLKMSLEVNLRLLKKGIRIETVELEKAVEAFKEAELEKNQQLFPGSSEAEGAEKASLYETAKQVIKELPGMPAAVVGKIVSTRSYSTLNTVHAEGSNLLREYQEAGERYETLMTAPRGDLGDSIRKAFRNIDALLEEIGLSDTEANERSVRILGYNQMEITPENVEKVRAADEELTRVIRKMTPRAVLQMIRDGVNPLDTQLPELESYLSAQDNSKDAENEQYAKFLYKLEQSNAITEEEKTAYMGIYRLLRKVEKSDGAAIGSILNQGSEVSFQNLLTALRTGKKTGMDVTIDDSVGGIEAVHSDRASISDQINQNIKGTISPETLERIFTEITEESGDLEKKYESGQLQQLQQIGKVGEEVVQSLLAYEQPVTVNHLLAYDAMIHDRGSGIKELSKRARELSKETETKLHKTVEKLQTHFEEEESYEELEDVAAHIMEETQEQETTSYIDLKSMALTFQQVSLMKNLARESEYEIPVEIGGELASLHLQIRRGSDKSKVSAQMELEGFGKMAADFTVSKDKITGCLGSSTKIGYERLKKAEKELQNTLKGSGKEKQLQIETVYSKDLKLESLKKEEPGESEETGKVSSQELYQIAKSFIQAIQKEEESR